MQVLPPSKALKSGLQRIGEQLTDEWLLKAGPTAAPSSPPTAAACDVRARGAPETGGARRFPAEPPLRVSASL